MTQIIDFQAFKGSRPQREAIASGGAEILFFLGVRYERMVDDAPEKPARLKRPASAPKKARKRRA